MAAPEVKPHILIVEARFYEDISDELAKGAVSALKKAGVTYDRLAVPGAFEIPAAIRMAIRAMHFHPHRRRYDGYVALGCVIRGDTIHFEIVAQESARALMGYAVTQRFPVGNGIITVDTESQAWSRARMEEADKGGDAVRACLAMVRLKRRVAAG